MHLRRSDLVRLASACVAGGFEPDALFARLRPLVGNKARWLKPLVSRIRSRFHKRPRLAEMIQFLRTDRGLERAAQASTFVIGAYFGRTEFVPFGDGRIAPAIPEWNTVSDLADWLEIELSELQWFADLRRLGRLTANGPLQHYRYSWAPKRGGLVRLIEAPKSRLKEIQRRLLSSLFDVIPVHEAVHGFRTNRSVATFVEGHVGKSVLLKMDLQDFFPSMEVARLTGIMMMFGYAEAVARTITALCSNVTPSGIWQTYPRRDQWESRRASELLYRRPHFPQGAPSSPAITNLCAFRFDCRLNGLARHAGVTYTRYADDLLFSADSEFVRRVKRFSTSVAAIAIEEGFRVNFHKTRIMTQSVRQRAAGLVLNTRPNVARDEYDRLKAILHRSVHDGPRSQNRDGHPDFRSHLLGRIAYIRQWSAARGDKLLKLFDQIAWE